MNRKSKNTVKNRWDFVGILTCACVCVRVCVCVGYICVLLCVYVWVVYCACVYDGTCAARCFYRMLVVNVSDIATVLSGNILYLFLYVKVIIT